MAIGPSPEIGRRHISVEALHLPSCSVPRPGAKVVWYQSSTLCSGVLIGHDTSGRPHILNSHGGAHVPDSYDEIRLANPGEVAGPCWQALPAGACILKPLPEESASFDALLNQRTPPGPRYIELVTEIWSRGFEVFVVGGTVRDVIAGNLQKDVDLVTTMPLSRLLPLLRAMYGYPRTLESGAARNGHFRLGGRPSSGDPFLDLCLFKYRQPGTTSALFGSDLARDVAHRDFACNAIYYDPVNGVLIDPSGVGTSDAKASNLTVICDPTVRTPIQIAQITIRFMKFLGRGFTAPPACCARIREAFSPCIPAMSRSARFAYFEAQVLKRYPKNQYSDRLEQLRSRLAEVGLLEMWEKIVEPFREELLA